LPDYTAIIPGPISRLNFWRTSRGNNSVIDRSFFEQRLINIDHKNVKDYTPARFET
jgi:hypothetical protein